MASRHEVARLLADGGNADTRALEKLIPLVREGLNRLSQRYFSQDCPDPSLHITALAREAYTELVGDRAEIHWQDRARFFGLAARLIRRILVKYSRQGPKPRIGGMDVVGIDRALERLATLDPHQCRLVELRYFAGLTLEEAAEILEIPVPTAHREWVAAKAWLSREVLGQSGHDS